MKRLLALLLCLSTACRIEKVKSADSASSAVDPGPGVAACGISPESRIGEDGLGLLRIGVSLESIRAGCTILSETPSTAKTAGSAHIDLGRDTAALDLAGGNIRKITLHHQAYRTADSLGVGTHITTLMRLRDAVGLVDHGKLYAVSPAYCGLRFMLENPAPKPPAAQSGKAALRRLSGEVRTLELEIVGCRRR
jgi:hypothetical protein